MTDYKAAISARLGPRGTFSACFALSIHKSGSTLMHNMISAACLRNGIPSANIPHLLFNEGLRDADWDTDAGLLPFFEDGRVYVGFRSLPPLFARPGILQERKSVLLVRDPRDALVSQYFSFGGRYISHARPARNASKFVSRLRTSAHLDIDAYVLAQAENYLGKLVAYQRALDFDNVLLRRYEEVYFDKERFLADIFHHFGIPVPRCVIREVAAASDVRPLKERRGQHIRKGTPGDHREKLQPRTIERLTRLFAPVCRDFGYALEAGAPRAAVG